MVIKKKRGFYLCHSCDNKGYSKKDMEHCQYLKHNFLWYSKDPDLIHELNNLIQIEDANLIGSKIKVVAVVASNTISYNVPAKIKVICTTDSDNHSCASSVKIDISDIDKVSFTEISEISRLNRCKTLARQKENFSKSCDIQITELEHSTIKKMRVRPVVSVLEKNDGKISDDEGNEWKAYDIYIKQETIQSHEAGNEIEIVGNVIAEPKNQKITLVANSVKKTDDKKPDIRKLKVLKKTLNRKKSLDEKCKWITAEFEKYSKITKRGNVTLASLMAFFSPLYFEFEGKNVPGWVKITIIGDSTTGKSQTVSQLILLLNDGQIISGETASIAGLGATTTQSSNSQWFIEYGPIVLQDKKLLAIDGAHKLTREHWATLAESERSGILKTTKAAKGEAHARIRQIKIMNPVSDDFRTTSPMKSFFHTVQSIVNSLQIQNIARQDLVVFVTDNVGTEHINIRNGHVHDKQLEYFSELLKICWRQSYEIIIEDTAYDEILKHATILEKKFKCEEIPLVTNDQKFKLTKLGIALAAITCSFDNNFTKLIVTKEHIQFVSKFIEIEYHNAGLDIVAEITHEKIDGTTIYDIIFDIQKSLAKREPQIDDEFCKELLTWSAQQTRFTKEQFATQFELADKNEVRPLLATMQNIGLINRKTGFIPTKKLIEIGKILVNDRGVSSLTPGKDGKDGKIDDSLPPLPRLPPLKQDTPITKSENRHKKSDKLEYFICYSCNKNGTEPALIDGISKNGITYEMHVKKQHKTKTLTQDEYEEYLKDQDQKKHNLFGNFTSHLSEDKGR